MPRFISGLVMQLMRVAHVGGAGFQAEVTSLSLRSSKNMLVSFKAKWSLLVRMQAS